MNRQAFLALAGTALVGAPRVARATGGLDVAASPEALHQMRVLLASGTFDPPRPIDEWHFAWAAGTYRGTATNVVLPDGRDGLVNTLPLDAYLYGVLSREVSALWAPAAQQAQAIAARTYALLKLRPAAPYDLVANESEAYGGIESETVEGREAVDTTGGTILVYDGATAHAAYSSCCGGRTADAGDVWDTPYPYLPSIADPHCAGTPGFAWNADIPLDALSRALGGPFTRIGTVRSVQIESDDPTDRPRALTFAGSAASFETTPTAFRASLGPSVVKSAFVRSANLERGSSLSLTGTGHGHGVGLCQWGTRVMADQGASAREILAFYFPGTSFGRG